MKLTNQEQKSLTTMMYQCFYQYATYQRQLFFKERTYVMLFID